MTEYIDLKNYAKHMNIKKNDIVFISSDVRKIVWDAIVNKKSYNLNDFIDGIISAVGEKGSVIFPTFNWDFCNGTLFDIRSSPCKTGALGTIALNRSDFIRTKHPIYSFAVYGNASKLLKAMDNIDSFGIDSPFAFFKNYNVKNYIIDVTLERCFTFAHFVEEHSGVVKYRYIKNFTAGYIDEQGYKSERTYSMFVRDLDLDVVTTIDPIEEDLIKCKSEEKFTINSSEIKMIYLGYAYDVLLNDIVNNRSRKLCNYKGQ